MAKSQEIATRPSGGQLAASRPDFMNEDGRMGTDLVLQKIRPPFLKIVQKQSSNELIDAFGIGAVILSPDNTLVLEPKAAPVRVIPLLFFVQYLKLRGIAFKGQEPMIADSSLDPSSELARKCMDRNHWKEFHPQHPGSEEHAYRNCETLSFLMMFEEEHLTSMPVVVSFMRGSFAKGQQFCNLISMRKAPIFGCVFELCVDPTPGRNAKGEWWRLKIDNPAEGPWVPHERYAALKKLHETLKSQYDNGQIELDYDEDETAAAVEGSGSDVGAYG